MFFSNPFNRFTKNTYRTQTFLPEKAENTRKETRTAAPSGQALSKRLELNTDNPFLKQAPPSLQNEQLLVLLKNLLKLPKDFGLLLTMLGNVPDETAKTLLETLLPFENDLSLQELQTFFQEQIGKAQTQLILLSQNSETGSALPPEQMGELLATLSKLSGQNRQFSIQPLETALALYIPLQTPQTFHLLNQQKQADHNKNNSQSTQQLLVFINTITLGRFKIDLLLAPGNLWHATIHHEEQWHPYLASFVDTLTTQYSSIGNWKQSLSFIDNLAITPKKDVPFNTESTTDTHSQTVALSPNGSISFALIQLAYCLISTLIELDNLNHKHQIRHSKQ